MNYDSSSGTKFVLMCAVDLSEFMLREIKIKKSEQDVGICLLGT